MVAAAASSAFFPVPAPGASPKPGKFGNWPSSLSPSFKPKSIPNGGFQVKANDSAHPKANGSAVSLKSGSLNTQEDTSSSPPPRTFLHQLPDWSRLLTAITTVFVKSKRPDMHDRKSKRPDMLVDSFGLESTVQDGLVFRQSFSIRSYEIGTDRTASIETLMNHLQETSLNHCKSTGILLDGFGRTLEMCKRDLIWVVIKMQIKVNRYPAWGDTVEINTRFSRLGKIGMGRDWLISDCNTGEILVRATSAYAMMNQKTRRLSKLPYEVHQEIVPLFVDSPVIEDSDLKVHKFKVKTGDSIQKGLTPGWNDLDVNQHVSNVKYIGWILESMPTEVLETQELCSLALEYRRECGRDSVLESVTAMDPSKVGVRSQYQHLLRLEDGTAIVNGATEWRPKNAGANGAISTGKTSNGNSVS
uniref:Acyl-[acyl-carrier-protein] hydrolase n=1 Tax=Cuphea hookeriana TaxID=36775 RepID=Q39514_CUPHO|nr:FatB2 [Cuphea hookeriana]AKP20082.1 acyl-ACP thioesterase [synthetic construct]AXO58992.1 FatB2 [synthetic construct]